MATMKQFAPSNLNHKAQAATPEPLPPHNREFEEALLGAILIAEGIRPEIADLNLTGNDFYIIKLGLIFEAMLELDRNNRPIDTVTLTDVLERQGKLDEVGGRAEVCSLLIATPTALHGPYYAERVKELAYRRRRIEAAAKAVQLYHNPMLPIGDVEAQVDEVWRDSQGGYAPKDTWQIYSLTDAYKPRLPVQEIVEGLITLPSLIIPYGPPGSLKTMLLQNMAVCVAGGLPWLPPLPGQNVKARQTIQTPVLWLDFDNGQRRTHERFEALARTLELPETTPLHYYSMPSPWLDAANGSQMQELARRIERLEAKLVIVDNLAAVSGTLNENTGEMKPAMSNFRQVADATGAAIAIIHHPTKSNGVKSTETLRGFGGIEGAIDLALLIKRIKGTDQIKVTATKERDFNITPFSAQFAYEHKLGTRELEQAQFFGTEIEGEEKDKTPLLQATILDCVKADPGLSQTKLRDKVVSLTKMGRNKVRDEIKAMADAGEKITVHLNGDGKAAAYYPTQVDF